MRPLQISRGLHQSYNLLVCIKGQFE
ncbi:UNVERIFIED_CONTAM: hypothetical protein GTU68_029685 [Idotea baltica]|nr:hypothetical protein [Idotea baltica]